MAEITIAEARKQLGLTQEQVADQLGLTRQTYAKLEQNPEKLTIGQARQICSVLGRQYETLFFGRMVN